MNSYLEIVVQEVHADFDTDNSFHRIKCRNSNVKAQEMWCSAVK